MNRPKQPSSAPMPTWDGPEYARVPPGRYEAVAIRVQGPAWVRRYRRWSLMIEFELFSESKSACAFFNMGTNAEKPHAGPQSRYFHAWCMANGQRPTKGQKLDPRVFLDGQVYVVEIEDSQSDAEGAQKDESQVYSRVKSVLSAELRDQPNQVIRTINQSGQSTNQPNQVIHDSGIMQSTNQESPNQGGPGIVEAPPQPGGGNAQPQQPQRAGASAPAQASGIIPPPHETNYHEVLL